jgi:hypothetical protein
VAQQSLFDELDTQGTDGSVPPKRRAGETGVSDRAVWDAWKARLLPGFVAPYCQASRLHRSCWWVDGLASSSRGTRSEQGSVAFAETAETLAASGFALHGIRLEARKPAEKMPTASVELTEAEPVNGTTASAQRNGRRAREQAQPPGSETLTPLPYEDALATLGTAPAILLLNPFAIPPLTVDELLPLCQRQAPTELLLTISTARLEQLAIEGLAGQAPPALTALLRSDTWKATWSGTGKSGDKARRTLELLRGMLKAHFLYVCVATLDDLPSAAPRRLLLFASRQYASVALLNDFLCAEQARLARERETRALQGSWFARRRETARAAAWAALKEELHTLGRLRRARLWPDLKPLLLLDHFGQFSAADHDAALLELLAEGRIACRWSSAAGAGTPPGDPDAAEQSARVPGPQDFLEFLETRTRPVWKRQ